MSTVAPEVESIEQLDFDPARPCEHAALYFVVLFGIPVPLRRSRGCDRPAGWLRICNACGADAAECDEHHREVLASDGVGCPCGASGAPLMVFRYVPFGVRS